MDNNSTATSLSELEGATLAAIKKAGCCTPYYIRNIFLSSPASVWSGSAGAIYPLIARLEKQGLLVATSDQVGQRKRTLYALSEAGEQTLYIWLEDVKRGGGIGFDPMRTRLHFAELYRKKDLRNYVNQAMAHMLAEIHAPENDDPYAAEMHQVWLAHRKAAIEEIMAILERP